MSKGGSGNYGTDQGFGRGIGGSSGSEVRWQDHQQDQREAQVDPELAELARRGGVTPTELQQAAEDASKAERGL